MPSSWSDWPIQFLKPWFCLIQYRLATVIFFYFSLSLQPRPCESWERRLVQLFSAINPDPLLFNTTDSFHFNALQFSIYPPTTQISDSNLSHFFFLGTNPLWWNSDWKRLWEIKKEIDNTAIVREMSCCSFKAFHWVYFILFFIIYLLMCLPFCWVLLNFYGLLKIKDQSFGYFLMIMMDILSWLGISNIVIY